MTVTFFLVCIVKFFVALVLLAFGAWLACAVVVVLAGAVAMAAAMIGAPALGAAGGLWKLVAWMAGKSRKTEAPAAQPAVVVDAVPLRWWMLEERLGPAWSAVAALSMPFVMFAIIFALCALNGV